MATYQVWAAPINDTLAHFQAYGQFFGAGFTTCGWVAQSGHGEMVASGSGASYAWTNPILPTIALLSPNSYTFKGAFVNTTAYVGSNTLSFATEVDVVTSGGVTYQCVAAASSLVLASVANAAGGSTVYTGTITGGGSNAFAGASFTIAGFSTSANNGTFVCTASSTTTLTLTSAAGVAETHAATANGNPATNLTQWVPIQFEIWKSNGSNTSSLPIYVKLIYTLQTNATTGPCEIMSIGTGVDSNGNLTNALTLTSSAPTFAVKMTGSATGFATAGEMDFAGDADNFRFAINRGAPSTSNINWFNLVVVDRSKTSSGVDTDAFFYFGGQLANNGAQTCASTIVLNSAIGSQFGSCTVGPWIGAVSAGSNTTSLALFGSSPALPILPVVGYVANPLLGAMGVHRADYINADGSIIPVWNYGALHNYIIFTQISAQAGFIDNAAANAGVVPCLLWE